MATWSVTRLDCFPQYGSHADVVNKIYWSCSDSKNGHTVSTGSLCFLPPPEGEFVPYSNLKPETVLKWLWDNGVSKENVEARLAQNLEHKINPPTVAKPLPWG